MILSEGRHGQLRTLRPYNYWYPKTLLLSAPSPDRPASPSRILPERAAAFIDVADNRSLGAADRRCTFVFKREVRVSLQSHRGCALIGYARQQTAVLVAQVWASWIRLQFFSIKRPRIRESLRSAEKRAV